MAAEGGRRKTRYDMQIELLVLKKRLEGERAERERLKSLKLSLEDVHGTSPGALPDWVKKLQNVAANSKTLRVQIGRKQAQNPDKLSFRERMLFYSSGAVEENIHGLSPPVPAVKRQPTIPSRPQYLGRVRS
eukprot:Unigene11448_Nuclearia_a/m.34914 Unigene11448_Nuclearia_a/g.34914  ORF Unigene11448_Nuclearia_a/g.34914 Unigene11448_Nuclearia_a/m.34914 type:complete len:132 (+) Unigene11448_Nuclearia_a:1-396(+)